MPEKIAVLGASGFVGSTLVEYLQGDFSFEVTPFAHSSGGATCLAHRGLVFQQIDILDRVALTRALDGFDYIVNCSRGSDAAMLDGIDNIIRASKKNQVKKLVHLSSVAVYGDPPHPDSTDESAPARPDVSSYGATKLAQDDKVQAAAANGLPCVILCPPNIIGPYSDYVIDIINSIEAERFCLLDDGRHVINVVDVTNLCAAIVAAIRSEMTDAGRLFVCEPEHISWAEFCSALEPMIRKPFTIASMSAAQFSATLPDNPNAEPATTGNAFKHLISDEVREAFRLHPTWAAIEGAAKSAVRSLGSRTEDYMREVANGPIKVDVNRIEPTLDTALIAQQLRQVRHDPSNAFSALAFQPIRSFEQSMQAFSAWYTEFFDTNTPEWALLGQSMKP